LANTGQESEQWRPAGSPWGVNAADFGAPAQMTANKAANPSIGGGARDTCTGNVGAAATIV
jgi:hypothetical protein